MNDSKVAPVEAQAVPDQLIKFCCVDCLGCEKCGVTRPTPAAADPQPDELIEAVDRLEAAHQNATDGRWCKGLTTHHTVSKREGQPDYRIAEFHHAYDAAFCDVAHQVAPLLIEAIRKSAAQLVAASPAAAAGVPTGWKLVPDTPTQEMCQAGQDKAREWPKFPLRISPIYKAMLAASPVAPVGAPTLTDEQINDLWDRSGAAVRGSWRATAMHFARALLSAQGCELATDATKQLGEHSVHLAVNDAEEDFRMRPASSEAAPSAGGGA